VTPVRSMKLNTELPKLRELSEHERQAVLERLALTLQRTAKWAAYEGDDGTGNGHGLGGTGSPVCRERTLVQQRYPPCRRCRDPRAQSDDDVPLQAPAISHRAGSAVMKVFIYGTLKRGFPLFDKGLVGARYLGDVETVEAYPLYIAGSFYGPMMLDRPGRACVFAASCSTSTRIVFTFSTSWKTSIAQPAFAVPSQSPTSGEEYRRRRLDT